MNNIKHDSSHLHVTGKATFIDDINLPENTLTGYVVTSKIARGKVKSFDISAALKTKGVKCILSYKNITGKNQMGVLRDDEPILVESEIEFYGQALFIIAAQNQQAAFEAEKKIKIEIQELEPVVTIEQSMEQDWKLSPTITMKNGNPEKEFSNTEFIISETIESGAQEHWYLETQVAVAIPSENNEYKIYSSTQHPSETQTLIAQALALPRHNIEVETRRIGGAFGGKETQANMVAIWAAVLAQKVQQPIKLRLNRIQDQTITGKRHPFLTHFKIGFNKQGIIQAYQVHFHANAGYSLDLSMPVMARARTHAENAYYIPNIKIESTCWKTNLPSNTAFRGFGAPQAIYAIEYAIEKMSHKLNIDAAEIRFKNFYDESKPQTTPYQQLVCNNRLQHIYNKLIVESEYKLRKNRITEFNKTSTLLKRGMACIPIKFGISFNTPFLNQAGALIHIYTDGSILVNHGGIEMGQGIHTKISQVVATELGVPLNKVKVNATNTSKIPNTSATAASSGTDLNGMAALNAIEKIKQRIASMLYKKWNITNAQDLPNYFSYTDGKIFDSQNTNNSIDFNIAIKECYTERISLSAQGYYATPNLHFNRESQTGQPFYYFAFGMSVSEIELDILTGDFRILQTDILHDAGNSINKNIDKGQIEGAFIQGMGWCTCEEISWNNNGFMLNHSPDTYKIPGIRNIPEKFNVSLLNNAANEHTIHKSKAVGEPPFIHGLSVFFAINSAICSIKDTYNDSSLSIPATNEKILRIIAHIKK